MTTPSSHVTAEKSEASGWTPVLKGEIYCSPRCGGNCKVADHNAAQDRAAELAALMGNGWQTHVWENLGWHWEVFRGECRISQPLRDFDRYMLMWNLPTLPTEGRLIVVPQIILHGADPVALLGLAKQDVRTWMARIEAQVGEVA